MGTSPEQKRRERSRDLAQLILLVVTVVVTVVAFVLTSTFVKSCSHWVTSTWSQ